MATYRLNGVELTLENGGLPSRHKIEYTPHTMRETMGATVMIEPPAGRRRTITWEYDKRYATDFKFLMDVLDYDSSPMSVIDCPAMEADPDLLESIQLTNLKVICTQKPAAQTLGRRDLLDTYSLVFVEEFPQ